MKPYILVSVLTVATFAFTSSASAQTHQERCTNYDSYALGEKDGSSGGVVGQADKRIKKCLKYGVQIDKVAYTNGVLEGQKAYCTAELGKKHRAENQTPAFACRMFDNPYMWEFRGQPLVGMPTEGAASLERARQDIGIDLDYLRAVYNRAESSNGSDVNERVALSRAQDRLKIRIDALEKQQSGRALLPAAVNSPGPKYRKGMTAGEITAGLFKASNWKSEGELSPMRIRKKNCKAGKWSEYGEQHGQFAPDIDEEIRVATKKCKKHKVVFDEVAYRAGFEKSIADYCGYEQGFFTALKDRDENANCTTGRFPTYTKGYRHGETRRQFVGIEDDLSRVRTFYENIVRFYNKGTHSPFDTILNEIDVKDVFRRRADIQRLIANERVRLNAFEADLEAHKSQNPELYQAQEIGIEPRPDRELDYPIPH